ncbi:MAG: UDP-N-acetylmuramate dehydrogenase [Thermoanaerobaculales bacterium]|nr:UDP-N-acetylmuramate dehydrogenase [Thermoanaerobaculales bacterium]
MDLSPTRGPAKHFVDVGTVGEVGEALRWAAERGERVHVLGGGSNLVVADSGLSGLVIHMANQGLDFQESDESVLVTVAAGENWDEVVAATVDRDLRGLECLSGIPGTAGATPIQNVGAYGAEVADVVEQVEVVDRSTFEQERLNGGQCSFRYRASRFKENPDRFVVTGVKFRLRKDGEVCLAYPELARAMAVRSSKPGPKEVREAVLQLRRTKGMVLEEGAVPNVGSFFVNPVLTAQELMRVEAAAEISVPNYPIEGDGFKVPAAWLIEQAGMAPGLRRGPVGVSSRHALSLVHHGGGSTTDLLRLAAEIRSAVQTSVGVVLVPEPVFWGFSGRDPLGSFAEGENP